MATPQTKVEWSKVPLPPWRLPLYCYTLQVLYDRALNAAGWGNLMEEETCKTPGSKFEISG